MIAYYAELGDVVALKSHPYFEKYTETVIAGEHQLTSPLMVVAEILKDIKTQFNEKTGEEESRIGFSSVKCIWYSHKTNQFEEVWISSKMLKLIEKSGDENKKDAYFYELVPLNENKSNEPKFKKYHNVVLKSNNLELGKRKSSMTFDEGSVIETKEERYTITAYLGFVSPVMEIIQILDAKDIEQKEVKYNPKSGERRKFSSDWLAKVKWFNPASDKFSEKILPISVLQRIEPPNETVLMQIKEAVSNLKYFRYYNEDRSETILKPKGIICKSGHYRLNALDYLTNKNRHLPIPNDLFEEEERYYTDKFPKYAFIETGVYSETSLTDELVEAILKAAELKKYIRIKYKNRNNKLSIRTLKEYEIKPVNNGKIKYLESYCMSSKEKRTFRIDEIQKLELLSVKF